MQTGDEMNKPIDEQLQYLEKLSAESIERRISIQRKINGKKKEIKTIKKVLKELNQVNRVLGNDLQFILGKINGLKVARRITMEGKAPGTLTEWVRLYTKNGWTSGKEILHIELELLDHLGPVTLEMVIEKAQELKATKILQTGGVGLNGRIDYAQTKTKH